MENRFGRHNHIDPRTKFNEADALPAFHGAALAQVEDNAPCQQPGNLLKRNLDAVAAHGHHVLLIRSAEAGFMALRYRPF